MSQPTLIMLVRFRTKLSLDEVMDVAKAHDVSLEPVGGTLDLQRLYLPPDRLAEGFGFDLIARHIIMSIVGLKFRRLRSSMLRRMRPLDSAYSFRRQFTQSATLSPRDERASALGILSIPV